MSRAPERPCFDSAGAPLSVLIDFDGTITRQDVGDFLLARFAPDQEEVRRVDQLYVDGLMGSRDLTAWDMDALKLDGDALLAAVDEVTLDPSIRQLVEVVEGVGAAFEIVSDGLGFHVERLLGRLGLAHLPVATNVAVPGRGGEAVAFPFGHPVCYDCGTCKRERLARHRSAGRAVVFIGDGPSDRYAAWHADVVFAKGSLARWCDAQGVAWQPWEHLSDVADWVAEALADGRLPRRPQDWGAWRSPRPERDPAYICGPESWPATGRVARVGVGPMRD